MRRFLLFLVTACLFAGLGYAGLLLYTHTDPLMSPPWQQPNVPAAAQRAP